jgi:hypothetical protein
MSSRVPAGQTALRTPADHQSNCPLVQTVERFLEPCGCISSDGVYHTVFYGADEGDVSNAKYVP